MIDNGALGQDFCSSMISILAGFALGFITAVPVAFLMAWYLPVRGVLEPWIQFIRNIPPLAYVPLVVITAGVGRKTSDYCYLDRNIPDYDSYNLSGRKKH